jgi:hypothetical protein
MIPGMGNIKNSSSSPFIITGDRPIDAQDAIREMSFKTVYLDSNGLPAGRSDFILRATPFFNFPPGKIYFLYP